MAGRLRRWLGLAQKPQGEILIIGSSTLADSARATKDAPPSRGAGPRPVASQLKSTGYFAVIMRRFSVLIPRSRSQLPTAPRETFPRRTAN